MRSGGAVLQGVAEGGIEKTPALSEHLGIALCCNGHVHDNYLVVSHHN
jgi:hypothetical protein